MKPTLDKSYSPCSEGYSRAPTRSHQLLPWWIQAESASGDRQPQGGLLGLLEPIPGHHVDARVMYQLGPSVRAEATQGTPGLLASTHRCQTGRIEVESMSVARWLTGRRRRVPAHLSLCLSGRAAYGTVCVMAGTRLSVRLTKSRRATDQEWTGGLCLCP